MEIKISNESLCQETLHVRGKKGKKQFDQDTGVERELKIKFIMSESEKLMREGRETWQMEV